MELPFSCRFFCEGLFWTLRGKAEEFDFLCVLCGRWLKLWWRHRSSRAIFFLCSRFRGPSSQIGRSFTRTYDGFAVDPITHACGHAHRAGPSVDPEHCFLSLLVVFLLLHMFRWRGPFLAEMEVFRRAIAWFGADYLPPDTVGNSQVREKEIARSPTSLMLLPGSLEYSSRSSAYLLEPREGRCR